MVVLSFVKYGNIHNAINFIFSIPCDAYLHIFYGLLHTFSSGPLRFCQQKLFSSLLLLTIFNCIVYRTCKTLIVSTIIVSTGSIRWILWFSVRYAAAARREIFGVNALRGKQQQLGSPNLQDIFIGGKLLWEGK